MDYWAHSNGALQATFLPEAKKLYNRSGENIFKHEAISSGLDPLIADHDPAGIGSGSHQSPESLLEFQHRLGKGVLIK